MPMMNGRVTVNLVGSPAMRAAGNRASRVIDREGLVAAALNSPEGRLVLAQAMIEPIRAALDYQGIGRRLLMLDEIPQGFAVPRRRIDPNDGSVPLSSVLNMAGTRIGLINLVRWDVTSIRGNIAAQGIVGTVFAETPINMRNLYPSADGTYYMHFATPSGTTVRGFRIHEVSIPWPQSVTEMNNARRLVQCSLDIENDLCVHALRTAAVENGTAGGNFVSQDVAIQIGMVELLDRGFLPRYIVCSPSRRPEFNHTLEVMACNRLQYDELFVVADGVCQLLVVDQPHIETRSGISKLDERVAVVIADPIGVRGFTTKSPNITVGR